MLLGIDISFYRTLFPGVGPGEGESFTDAIPPPVCSTPDSSLCSHHMVLCMLQSPDTFPFLSSRFATFFNQCSGMLAILTVGDCRNCPIFVSDQKRHIIRSPSKHVVHCEVGKILDRVS